MSLYQLTAEYEAAFDKIVDMDDEQMIADTIEALEGELSDKIANVGKYIKNLASQSEAIKNAEKNMAERRKSKDAAIKRLKKNLANSMQKIGIKKVDAPDILVSLRKTPDSMIINDDSSIPDYFLIETTTIDINKAELKRSLKDGNKIKGVELVSNIGVTIK